jgi:hypothetical protein
MLNKSPESNQYNAAQQRWVSMYNATEKLLDTLKREQPDILEPRVPSTPVVAEVTPKTSAQNVVPNRPVQTAAPQREPILYAQNAALQQQLASERANFLAQPNPLLKSVEQANAMQQSIEEIEQPHIEREPEAPVLNDSQPEPIDRSDQGTLSQMHRDAQLLLEAIWEEDARASAA